MDEVGFSPKAWKFGCMKQTRYTVVIVITIWGNAVHIYVYIQHHAYSSFGSPAIVVERDEASSAVPTTSPTTTGK